MNVVTNILNFLCGFFEITSIFICFNLFGIFTAKNISKYRFVLAFVAYSALSFFDFFLINSFTDSVGFILTLLYVSKLLLPLLPILGRIDLKTSYIAILLDVIFSFLSNSAACIIDNLCEAKSTDYYSIIDLCIKMAILALLIFISKKADTKKVVFILNIIPLRVFILLLLTVLCLGFLASLVNFNTENYILKENLMIALIVILSVFLAYIISLLFLNVIAKQHFTATSQMMEKQVELQINHYKELEKMDAEMRRFRHDYTNHLRSVLSLIHMKEYSDAEEYIEKIRNKAFSSKTVMFYTGNKLADAILADKSAALDENCRIDYSGIMPTSIENVDLCIILSNALDNAVEACREFDSPCTISVFAGEQQGYFVLSLKNPTAQNDSLYDIPPTTKSNKDQHGMGLYNIESTVKKYDGQMKIKRENGVFELMLTMKL